MIVFGVCAPEHVIEAAVARMKAAPFTAYSIECVFATGVTADNWHSGPMRAADRLIQKMRKAGKIEYQSIRRGWTWKA